jgi:RNA polymerase sigma-70 factor (ECF subfamily)
MPFHEIDSIIAKCKEGNQHAFAILCEHYYPYAFRLSFRILANEEDAKDTVQEVFIKIWKHIPAYNNEVKFTTWMYTIITNLCIDKLRKQKLFLHASYEEAMMKVDLSNQEIRFDNKDLAEIIVCITKELSPKQRVIFTLRDLEGLETDEIEKITGLHPNHIKSNLYHARKTIREKLIKTYKVEY